MKSDHLDPATAGSGATVPSSQDIERRARTLWEEEGRPEGRALEHWLAAERELRQVQEIPSGKAEDAASSGNPAYPPLAEREKIVASRAGSSEHVEKIPASKLSSGPTGGAKVGAGSPELPAGAKRGSRRGATRG